MLDERWKEITDMIKGNFEVLEHEVSDLEDMPGNIEHIVFVHPQGDMKLERTKRPKMLDKKTSYSGRAGSDVNVEYQYSDDEMVDFLQTFLWDDEKERWNKLDINMFEE